MVMSDERMIATLKRRGVKSVEQLEAVLERVFGRVESNAPEGEDAEACAERDRVEYIQKRFNARRLAVLSGEERDDGPVVHIRSNRR